MTLIWITFQSAIKTQSSFKFGHFSPKYQGYSLTFWPKMTLIWITFQSAMQLKSQSISNLVIFHQNTKAIALLFGQKCADLDHFSICNQNQSISNLVIFHQNTKAIALLFGQKSLICITFQSAIKINQFQIWSFSPKYQGYSLTFWPKIADLHHFSICNQNQSISNLVIFHQNTKAIALLYGQTSLIWITFQSAIKINQFQIWSFFTKIPRL